MLAWPSKFAAETNDYTIDWSARLTGETIFSATVVLTTPAGVSITLTTQSTTSVTVWLAGGVTGQTCTALCTITTTAGRTMVAEVQIYITA